MFNPLSKVRDHTCLLVNLSPVRSLLSHSSDSEFVLLECQEVQRNTEGYSTASAACDRGRAPKPSASLDLGQIAEHLSKIKDKCDTASAI